MKKILLEYFFSVIKGHKIWFQLKKESSIHKAECIFFFPDNYEELNKIALNNLITFLNHKKRNSVIIILNKNNKAISYKKSYNIRIQIINTLSYIDIVSVINYIKLLRLPIKIKVVSFNEPFGSPGWLQKKEISLEHLVSVYFFEGIK